MSSGSYFPPPVRAVSIPKKTGGQRILGVPTVADRVAQMVVKQHIEPELDPVFLADSYGYRPRKSALDAVGVTRQRCWKYDWVLEFDIKGLFDNIDHELLLRAVRKHVTCKWALLYIERWLTAPWSTKTVRRLSERVAPLRVVLSARSCRTCSCITRSISGWRGRTRTFRGVDMLMMDWFTAGTSKKPRPSRRVPLRFATKRSTARCGRAAISNRWFSANFGPLLTLEHRIGDKRIIRLVQKWLRAGVLEDGIVTIEEKGTGQGAVISPLLANAYLHYVFDLWAERWRRREATAT